jgi:hypothetical protein
MIKGYDSVLECSFSMSYGASECANLLCGVGASQ